MTNVIGYPQESNTFMQQLTDFFNSLRLQSSECIVQFIGRFLLPREIAVLKTLVKAIVLDTSEKEWHLSGWRNKHQICIASEVSQKSIYKRNGIIDRLLALNLLETRPSTTSWGRQKRHYRVRIENPLIEAFVASCNTPDNLTLEGE